MENDAACLLGVEPKSLGEVPGNCFSLAVFIGSEPDLGGLLSGFLEFCNNFFLVFRDDILRGKAVGNVYAERLLLKIPYVSEAGLYGKSGSEKLLNGFRLCSRTLLRGSSFCRSCGIFFLLFLS